jgi:serine/threonine protein phosphatase PrpC
VNFTRSHLLDSGACACAGAGAGASAADLDAVCRALVAAALDRGSTDNVSVIVVAFNQA